MVLLGPALRCHLVGQVGRVRPQGPGGRGSLPNPAHRQVQWPRGAQQDQGRHPRLHDHWHPARLQRPAVPWDRADLGARAPHLGRRRHPSRQGLRDHHARPGGQPVQPLRWRHSPGLGVLSPQVALADQWALGGRDGRPLDPMTQPASQPGSSSQPPQQAQQEYCAVPERAPLRSPEVEHSESAQALQSGAGPESH